MRQSSLTVERAFHKRSEKVQFFSLLLFDILIYKHEYTLRGSVKCTGVS